MDDFESKNAPEGYRKILDRTILDYYLKMDKNSDCLVSKNEWMVANLQLLFRDLDYIEKLGPNSIMQYIEDISDEFDKLDKDYDNYLQFADLKEKYSDTIYVEED